jgi:hypothetical protein
MFPFIFSLCGSLQFNHYISVLNSMRQCVLRKMPMQSSLNSNFSDFKKITEAYNFEDY